MMTDRWHSPRARGGSGAGGAAVRGDHTTGVLRGGTGAT
jgi:hypothetical protein